MLWLVTLEMTECGSSAYFRKLACACCCTGGKGV
jgi:hypothetical protein